MDKEFLDKLYSNVGTKIYFEGARSAESEECLKSPKLLKSITPSSAFCRTEGLKRNTMTEIIMFQVQGRLCALNAVANAMTIPMELYEEIKKQNPELKRVVERVRQAGIAHFHKVKEENDKDLQAKMLDQKSGIFAVRFGTHCLTWDANSQVILDTDPEYPHPLPINEQLLKTLKNELGNLTLAYKIIR